MGLENFKGPLNGKVPPVFSPFLNPALKRKSVTIPGSPMLFPKMTYGVLRGKELALVSRFPNYVQSKMLIVQGKTFDITFHITDDFITHNDSGRMPHQALTQVCDIVYKVDAV